MRRLLLFLTVVLAVTVARSQTTFQKTIGGLGEDWGHSIVQTSDWGFAVAGRTTSFNSGDFDMYVLKLDSVGALQWTRTIGGANYDAGHSIVQTSDGGYAVAGSTSSFGAGNFDVFLVKLNSSGIVQWTRTVGGTSVDASFSVIQTGDGGFALAGYTDSFGTGVYDMYVVKFNSLGALQWTRTIGGSGIDNGYSIVQTFDGGFAVGGRTASFGAGSNDMYLAKLDSTGSLQWTRTVGGTSSDECFSIVQTINGGFALAGRTFSFGTGSYDVYVVMLDSSGALQWTRTVGGTGGDECASIVQTVDGGFVLAGYSISFGVGGSDMYVVKLDNIGALQWTRTIGGTDLDRASSIVQTGDESFVVVGNTYSFGAGMNDVFVIKLDSIGGTCSNQGAGGIAGSGGAIGSGGSGVNGGITGIGGVSGVGGIVTDACASSSIYNTSLGNEGIELVAYPNPFSTQITLWTSEHLMNATLTVDNCFGQSVAQIKNLSGQTITFSRYLSGRDNLASGLYFVRLAQDNKVIATTKLIIID